MERETFMHVLVESVIHFLTAHPHIASVSAFFLALSESLPVVGLLIPGTTLIIMLAALVPSGILKLWPLLISAILGAIAGDSIAFWLGHRYHREILGHWPLNRYPEIIRSSEEFFARHGGKSIFLARFTPAVRAFIPLLAGMLGMSPGRFALSNVVSAFCWAPIHILPGVFAGAALSRFGTLAKPLAVLLVLVVATAWVALLVVRCVLRYGAPLLATGAERLRILRTGDTRLGRLLARLPDPERRETWTLLILGAVLVGAAWLFFSVLEDVVTGDTLVLADQSIRQILQGLRTRPGDAIMITITELGDPFVVIALTGVIALWLAWKRAWRPLRYWILAVGGASALNTAIKVALHRPRPNVLLYSGWSAFSFPSGHSTVNMVLYGFLTFLVLREVRPRRSLPLITGASLLVFLIAFSRLYLGAHWFSDVIGGLAFGSLWIALLALFYTRRPCAQPSLRGILAVGSAALLLAWGLHIGDSHAEDMRRYAVRSAAPSIERSAWWDSDYVRLPERRIALTGKSAEPLTFQWGGSLQDLEEVLAPRGWHAPVGWSAPAALAWLTKSNAFELPVFPLHASGYRTALTLVHPLDGVSSADARLVLRLWPADFELEDAGGSVPLWVGSVVEERVSHPFSLFTLARRQPDVNAPLRVLAEAFDAQNSVLRQRASPKAPWDGRVLLAEPDKTIRP